jgi:hypothetical protein
VLALSVLSGVLVLSAAVGLAQEFDLPGFVKADEQIPAQTPEADQQVAVFRIDLQATDDGAVDAKVISQRIVNSFAPKATARSGGDWEVRVDGDRSIRFTIPNPLFVDVESRDDKVPHERRRLNSYEWTLVVPLYDQRGPVGAERITVTNLSTKDIILEAAVRQE